MSDSRTLLQGRAAVVHAVLAQVRGSSPREEGAEMYVTAQAAAGTIGGGQAEYRAIAAARDLLAGGRIRDELSLPLGPEIGQCCGGHVTIRLTRLSQDQRAAHLAQLGKRARGDVLILGAGHVGRALAAMLAPLPLRVTLVDTRAEELAKAPAGLTTRLTPLPEAEIAAAPPASAYVVLTHDHGLDFLLTLAALRRGDAAYVGLIGSQTKRARFARFARETDRSADLRRLTCPIGAQGRGDKHPGVIALHTAQEVFAALALDNAAAPEPIAQN